MLKVFSGFLFFLFIHEGLGCIPTKPDDGHYIMIPATDPICLSPPWTVFFFIGNGVVLEVGSSMELGKKNPVETCDVNYSNGGVKYYDRRTPVDWTMADMNEAAGFWNRENCADPCVCTANACYQPMPGPVEPTPPDIYFYPHCNDAMDCFMVVVFYSIGSLVNPNNPKDMYDTFSKTVGAVNNSSYPKVTKLKCTGCPVEMQK